MLWHTRVAHLVVQRDRGASFSIRYRIANVLGGAAKPGTRLQRFAFAPILTPQGSFSLAVDYQPSATVTILEQTTSPPPLPQIIADYIGGAAPGQAGGGWPRSQIKSTLTASLYDPHAARYPDPASSPPISSGAPLTLLTCALQAM